MPVKKNKDFKKLIDELPEAIIRERQNSGQDTNNIRTDIVYPTQAEQKKKTLLITSVSFITVILVGMWFFNFKNTVSKLYSPENNTENLVSDIQNDFSSVVQELSILETEVQATGTEKADLDKLKKIVGDVIEDTKKQTTSTEYTEEPLATTTLELITNTTTESLNE